MTVGTEIRIDVGKNREIRHITNIVTPNPASPATNIDLDAPLSLPHVTNTQISVDGTSTGSTVGVGFMPNFAVEGQYEGMEFANGHYGLLEAALAYQNDHTAPTSSMITVPGGGPTASSSPIQATFKWGNEPSVIYYTLDGSTPTLASPKWEAQGPRRPGEIFTFDHTTTVKWFGVDIVGNTSAVQSQRFAVEADAPTTTASFSPAAQNGYYRNPSVTLIADDNFDGGGSGIASTEYKLDGAAAWTTYSGCVPGDRRRVAHARVPVDRPGRKRRGDPVDHVQRRRNGAGDHDHHAGGRGRLPDRPGRERGVPRAPTRCRAPLRATARLPTARPSTRPRSARTRSP